jgi:hypothetical protein
VHNLSAMTAEEAAAFLAMRDGRVCVAYERRDDGLAVFADAPAGSGLRAGRSLPVLSYRTPPVHRRRWLVPAAVAGAVVSAGAAVALNGSSPAPLATVVKPTPPQMVAGGMSAPPAVQFDPRNVPISCDSSAASSVANSVKFDPVAKRLVDTLPGGTELIDVKYSVYPPGMRTMHGRCYLIATGAAEGSPAELRAVLWRVPAGDNIDPQGAGAWALTAGRARTYGGIEWLVDTDDAELSRFLTNALAELSGDGSNPL